jgi:hypothetical protein
MLEDLDEKRLKEFLLNLEEFKERIELKKKKKNGVMAIQLILIKS